MAHIDNETFELDDVVSGPNPPLTQSDTVGSPSEALHEELDRAAPAYDQLHEEPDRKAPTDDQLLEEPDRAAPADNQLRPPMSQNAAASHPSPKGPSTQQMKSIIKGLIIGLVVSIFLVAVGAGVTKFVTTKETGTYLLCS